MRMAWGTKGWGMNISKTRKGSELTVRVAGELNTSNARELREQLEDEVRPDDTIVFELSELSYVTSAGLRIFMACDDLTGSRHAVILRNVREEIRDILEMTGFDTVLVIE